MNGKRIKRRCWWPPPSSGNGLGQAVVRQARLPAATSFERQASMTISNSIHTAHKRIRDLVLDHVTGQPQPDVDHLKLSEAARGLLDALDRNHPSAAAEVRRRANGLRG